MNISTGGPHILLFERDQQLTGLLISEFQLAGYECHTARTAVEVFDAIARQPIRLVLVNLAQAAAARREFWVALDTQRRGRGVQVMTFQCANIANYGPKDPDEHATTMVDLEVDGMPGIMGLVEAMRARVPVGENTAGAPQKVIRSTAGQANVQRPISPAGPSLSFANSGSGLRSPQENTPTLLSAYNAQNSQLPTIGELAPGEMLGRAQFSGQSMGSGGFIPPQPAYTQTATGSGNMPPQPFYTQGTINPGGMSAQPSPYAQSTNSMGSIAAQQSPYTQNTNSPGNMSAQPSPYAQPTNSPANIPAQQSSYLPNASGLGSMPVQQSPYAQPTNSPGSMPTQQSSYLPNASGPGSMPVQQSPYAQPTNSPGSMPTQQSLYTQATNGPGGISTQQPSYAQPTNSPGSMPTQQSPYLPNASNPGNGLAQPSYTEKIRAVLYPNQRAWSPQGTAAPAYMPENRSAYETPVNPPAPQPAPQPAPANEQSTAASVLQRLASGQAGAEGPWESGLAQLSRMVQESSSNSILENTSNTPAYHLPRTPYAQEPPPGDQPFGQAFQPPPRPQEGVQLEPRGENLSISTMRASPIQDLPVERNTSSSASNENAKRPDVLSRTNYAQQAAAPLASLSATTQVEGERSGVQEGAERAGVEDGPTNIQAMRGATEAIARVTKGRAPNEPARPIKARVIPEPPVAAPDEIVQEPLPVAPNKGIQDNMQIQARTVQEAVQPVLQVRTYPPVEQIIQSRAKGSTQIAIEEEEQQSEQNIIQSTTETSNHKETESNKRLLEKAQEEIKAALGQHTSFDTGNTPSNALLLDIMQSLPPMPAPQQQIQPQVLNGRATRSLGSVLLEGHLVPQSRLEVAQNVQRMLRGVDLNYQLGEILLMFKLLTPDQLLAASLVSYGLITTTQISALGRIRQELHAIGLEYDLENLLIMFRILTPEQLREVRANWQ